MIWEIWAKKSTSVQLENKTILKLDEFENMFSLSVSMLMLFTFVANNLGQSIECISYLISKRKVRII